MAKRKNDQDLAVELINDGAEMTGAAVGAAIGLIGGPVAAVGGAVAGSVAGKVIARVGSELKKRFLGPREEIRVGAVMGYVGEYIAEGLRAGQVLRDDGFFNERTKQRGEAESILEGILLKARDDYEEKKLSLLGALYANIAFSKAVSAPYAHQLIKLLGELTYRQTVIMAVAYEQTEKGIAIFKDVEFRSNNDAKSMLTSESVSLLTEAMDIYQKGLANDSGGEAWLGLSDVNLGRLRLQGTGAMLAQMAAFSLLIPKADKAEIINLIK